MEDVVRKYKFPPFLQIENNMEDVVGKCPHIGINIFGCLDFKSLNECKDVCKTLSLQVVYSMQVCSKFHFCQARRNWGR